MSALKPEHQAAAEKYISTDHKGNPINKAALLKKNPMVAKILVARIMAMSPEDRQSLKAVLTPDTEQALRKLLPELNSLIDKGMGNGATG